MLDQRVDDKLQVMKTLLRSYGRVVVAYSGGVDSTFVVRIAVDSLGAENVLAVTGQSPSLGSSELAYAKALADQLGVAHEIVSTTEFQDSSYLSNPKDRCYFCKDHLYTILDGLTKQRELGTVVSGTNADDLSDYRPGLQAASKHQIEAPAAQAGLTKSEIRSISRLLGLPTHDKPASPCLSSRIQYGEAITPAKLRQVEKSEQVLKNHGFYECRVRHHDKLARIEIPVTEFDAFMQSHKKIEQSLRELGYLYVTLDLRGLRSGSMNDVIPLGIRLGPASDVS